ncbi:Hint domain-containing protein [uncultured Roseovarius sp.]|uniref:Hint domain-containing protein n=1 Tax=uncultured Roseovarius sp. TaxID=293344 RepID=UPI002611B52B|nr:Hint domain-containing protein [uncultured Roseovarius sp.]
MLGWIGTRADGSPAWQDDEPVAVQSGLLHGTRVATGQGWRPVQALCAGDLVVTFDAGMQPLTGVTRHPVWTGGAPCPSQFWPLELSRGTLGNRGPVRIMPRQAILIESDLAETLWGDPFALLPGAALSDLHGVHRVTPGPGAEVVALHFETQQIVFAEHGAMFLCLPSRGLLDYAGSDDAAWSYQVLSLDQARLLVSEINGDPLAGQPGRTLSERRHAPA